MDTLVSDPDFMSMGAADQRRALAGVSGDNDFNTLSDEDTTRYIQAHQATMKGAGSSNSSNSPFPFTPQPNESSQDFINRVVNWGKQNPKQLQQAINTSTGVAKKQATDAAPYVGAAAATMLAPEGLPWYYAALARMGLAGAGGGATKAATNLATGAAPLKGVPTTAGEQAGYEGLGFGISKGSELLATITKMSKAGAMPADILAYLTKHGVSSTAGERIGPGLISAGENVIGSTAIGASQATKFGASRQQGLINIANDIVNRISPTSIASPITRGSSVPGIEGAAATELNSTVGGVADLNRLTSATGAPQQSPAELGEMIRGAIKGQFESGHPLSQEMERSAYNAVLPQIQSQGIEVTPTETQQSSLKYLREAKQVEQVLGKYPQEERPIMDSLRALSGEGIKDKAAAQLFDGMEYDKLDPARQQIVDRWMQQNPSAQNVPFDAFWKARQEFGSRIGTLRSQGVIDDKRLGVLDQIYGSMTKDMMSALPADLRSGLQSAFNLTAGQKELFGGQFIKSVLHSTNPMAAESVVDTLIRPGEETDINNMMKVLGNDPQAMGTLRQATQQWFNSNIKDADQGLKLLDARPGLRQILGPNYDALRSNLAQRALSEATPDEMRYQGFLKGIVGSQDPSTVISKAVSSPYVADQLSRLATDPALRSRISSDMIGNIFDSATKGGVYGIPGSELDPHKLFASFADPNTRQALSKFMPVSAIDNLTTFARASAAKDAFTDMLQKATTGGGFDTPEGMFDARKFSSLWSEHRFEMSHLLTPNQFAEIDKLGSAGHYLTFQPGSSPMAGRMGTLRQLSTLGALGAGVGTIGFLMRGDPTMGVLLGASSYFGPKAFMAAVTSPMGARLLSEGIKIPIASPEAAAWAVRMGSYIAQQATSQQPPASQQPSHQVVQVPRTVQ